MNAPTVIEQILDLARWAPSGDNEQRARFEIVAPDHVRIHCKDTRHRCVYDLDGHPSEISYGALLETLAIAASGHGLRADVVRHQVSLQKQLFDVRLTPDAGITPSPLIPYIVDRHVQRRPMSTRPLTEADKLALRDAVGEDYQVLWLEGLRDKWRSAVLMYRNARLRLTMPEAYEVHRHVIDWNTQFSKTKVPDQALGVDAMTLKLMHWGMQSWQRLARVNAILGTAAPRLQMDLIPGLACAAHAIIKARKPPRDIDDYVAAGRALQRFWLTLTARGLYMQPEMTPLIFARYIREYNAAPDDAKPRRFTRIDSVWRAAVQLQPISDALLQNTVGDAMFVGRVGAGPAPRSYSVRRDLPDLVRK
jgi:nitroreductase